MKLWKNLLNFDFYNKCKISSVAKVKSAQYHLDRPVDFINSNSF